MLGRRGGTRGRWRALLALAALACVLPARSSAADTVPLAAPFPSPEPGDAPRAWLGARVHRDWEPFEMTLSDGTRYARPTPADRFAAEVGVTFGPRLSASLDLTSSIGLGSAVQVDLYESPRAKIAAILQAELGTSGLAGGPAIAAAAATTLGGARLVPFVRVGSHAGRVSQDRGVRDRATPYNEADRWELAVVGSAGLALAWRRLELAVTGGYRAIAAAGRFEALRPADATREGGALAIASVRWVFPLARGD